MLYYLLVCFFFRIIIMLYLFVLDFEIRNVLFNLSLKYVYVIIFFLLGLVYFKLFFKVVNWFLLLEVENVYKNVVY